MEAVDKGSAMSKQSANPKDLQWLYKIYMQYSSFTAAIFFTFLRFPYKLKSHVCILLILQRPILSNFSFEWYSAAPAASRMTY